MAASTDFEIRIEHPFAQISSNLLDFIKENIRKQIGIVTSYIEDEAFFNLSKAVQSEINKGNEERGIDFEIYSAIKNICDDRLRKYLDVLRREPVDDYQVNIIGKRVELMYYELIQKANDIKRDIGIMVRTSAKRFRKIAKPIYKNQDTVLNAQLLNLIDNPAEYSDMKILSQAKYLLDLYKQTEGGTVEFYIASCDYHFSPVKRGAFISKQVTDKIYSEFDIKCNFPDEVLNILKKEIK
ncbi:MAG: hypothetical protein EAX96_21490 [Candidatus Lokiarchaeota archaeon]|nr:hypothetical protein [Candidatus Lokiarchaeota archaeon]